MFIKLTNSAEGFDGLSLLISVDRILTVYESDADGEISTFVFSDTRETWKVKESIGEIEKLLEN